MIGNAEEEPELGNGRHQYTVQLSIDIKCIDMSMDNELKPMCVRVNFTSVEATFVLVKNPFSAFDFYHFIDIGCLKNSLFRNTEKS